MVYKKAGCTNIRNGNYSMVARVPEESSTGALSPVPFEVDERAPVGHLLSRLLEVLQHSNRCHSEFVSESHQVMGRGPSSRRRRLPREVVVSLFKAKALSSSGLLPASNCLASDCPPRYFRPNCVPRTEYLHASTASCSCHCLPCVFDGWLLR